MDAVEAKQYVKHEGAPIVVKLMDWPLERVWLLR